LHPEHRLKKHLSGKFDKGDHKSNWLRHLQNIGLLNKVELVIIEEREDFATAIFDWMNEREKFWIAKFLSEGYDLTNSSIGGQGCKGYRHTTEAIEKIRSAAHEKRIGMIFSKAHRENISNSLLGNQRRKGKFCSEEQKKNISIGRSGIKAWNSGKKVQYSEEQLEKQKSGVKKFFSEKATEKKEKLAAALNKIEEGKNVLEVIAELQMTSKQFFQQVKYYKLLI
jgi:hypothetical protein